MKTQHKTVKLPEAREKRVTNFRLVFVLHLIG